MAISFPSSPSLNDTYQYNGRVWKYDGDSWASLSSDVYGNTSRTTFIATSGQTVFSPVSYNIGHVDVYLNGVKLVAGTDFTATTGTSITLLAPVSLNDDIQVVADGTFALADTYSQTQIDLLTQKTFSFYKADSTSSNISLTSASELPFFDASGASKDIALVA